MLVDLLIRRGILVTEDDVYPADLAVADGQIAAILEPDTPVRAETELDAGGLHLFAGLVDNHVHFNEPGRTHWEGFETGSRAAAAGGVTTVLDMPLNCIPPTLDVAALETKRAAVAGSSVVDYGFWGGLVDDNSAELPALHAAGVVGCKAFMCDSGIAEYPRVGAGVLVEGLRRLGAVGGIVGLHAEAHEATGQLGQRLRALGRRDPRAWAESRPAFTETVAAEVALGLAGAYGGRVHFVHVSAPGTVRAIDAARRAGVAATLETCPHYLALDEDDLARLGPIAKCAPPPRPRALVEELWRCLRTGMVDCLASDHSPSTAEEKRLDGGDIWPAWGGIAGVQTTLPVLLTEGFRRRGLPLPLLSRLVSGNPARIFGLAPRKGAIRPSADADLVLVDLAAEWELRAADLFSRNRLSPFIGRRFQGRVRQTLVRGAVAYRDGEIVAPPGHGCEVRPRWEHGTAPASADAEVPAVRENVR